MLGILYYYKTYLSIKVMITYKGKSETYKIRTETPRENGALTCTLGEYTFFYLPDGTSYITSNHTRVGTKNVVKSHWQIRKIMKGMDEVISQMV